MMRFKYIVHQSIKEEGLPETIVLFPDFMKHSDFKGCFRIISAGFVAVNYKVCDEGIVSVDAHCHGHSESLHMNARPEDSLLANIMLRNQI